METPLSACNASPMPKPRQSRNGLDIKIVWKPEVVEAWERGEVPQAMVEFVQYLARAAEARDYREFLETGESRWMSSDPNVDWAAHDAKWAKKDAEAELQRQEAIIAEKRRKKEDLQRRKAEKAGEPLAPQTHHDVDPPNMARLSVTRRLEIADEIAVAHPGKPVSRMLLELFPELGEMMSVDSAT